MIKIRRALLSVSDKTGLLDLAKALAGYGVELISTGGTYKALQSAGIPVTYISDVTGFPEILDGRVKTLHPKIHGGILAIRDSASHVKQMDENGIKPIDMVVVNLYPFEETIAKEGTTLEEAIENIDIGGPAMIRSAAKNNRYVAVVVNPVDYGRVIESLRENGGSIPEELAFELAVEAFRHTARYDTIISGYLAGIAPAAEKDVFPEAIQLSFVKAQDLRYGENPHQAAAFYRDLKVTEPCIANARQLHGKELSFNNINDGNAALELVKEFDEPAVVAIKHANPCGVGVGRDIFEAYKKAYVSDPVSIFGGIIAANREVDPATAEEISNLFIELVIAPSFSPEAFEILTKKKNIRLLETGPLAGRGDCRKPGADGCSAGGSAGTIDFSGMDLKRVAGGLLVQGFDKADLDMESIKVVTDREPTKEEWEDLRFAWKVVKYVKSNGIVLAKSKGTIGVGPGQTNRVGAARIAIGQAGEKAKGSVLASDAFFPMPDTVEEAVKAGVTAIIQPGGSIRDEDSIVLCNKAGIAMVFTGIRHFRH